MGNFVYMKSFCFILFFLTRLESTSQSLAIADSSHLLELNQLIDDFVVKKNLAGLDSLYAADFVFSHGSGRVEGKARWMNTVERVNYPQRQHDSVRVEMHPGIAILKGKMAIHRIDKDKTARYHLRYLRVFAFRQNRWQLISHSTTHEWHE